MLGLILRVVLKLAPSQFPEFIFPTRPHHFQRGWAFQISRHSKQLHDPLINSTCRMMKRSFFSLIYSYNNLPQFVVDSLTIKSFQRVLQNALKKSAEEGVDKWEMLFRRGVCTGSVRKFRAWFDP